MPGSGGCIYRDILGSHAVFLQLQVTHHVILIPDGVHRNAVIAGIFSFSELAETVVFIGDCVSFSYDNQNRQTEHIRQRNDGTDRITTSVRYDVNGNVRFESDGNNVTTKKSYDVMKRLETVTFTVSGVEQITTYRYDKNGNLTHVTYEYYANGSRKSVTYPSGITEEYTYYPDNTLWTLTIKYADGTVMDVYTYTYDAAKRNQLIESVTADGTTLTNAYNGEGLRVSKTVNGETTYFLYDYDKVVLEVYADGTQKARNLYGTNLLMRTVDGESYYYIYNGHADVTALISADGTIAATYYYDAFGNILEQTGNVDNNITYAGYQYDEETGQGWRSCFESTE